MRGATSFACVLFAAAVSAQSVEPAAARQETQTEAEEPEPGLFERRLPCTWLKGEREELEERGLKVDVIYNTSLGWVTRGEESGAGPEYSHSFDVFLRADFERMGFWEGGSGLVQAKNNYRRNVNPDVGALSDPVDDADFNELAYIDQFWVQQRFLSDRARFRFGYLDYQTAVDRNAYANSEDIQFSSTFLDNNPTVPLKIGFGATLFYDPTEWLGLIVGTADALNEITDAGFDTAFEDTDDLMTYVEAGLRYGPSSERGELPGNFRLGAFRDPRRRPVYGTNNRSKKTYGVYISADQLVYRESDEDEQGLGLFARYGWREDRTYEFDQFRSAGLQYKGLFHGRDSDLLGVAAYDTIASDRYQDEVDSGFRGETGFELYYRVQIAPWLAITPDVQFIKDPGGQSSARDAVVFVLRTRIQF